MTPPDVPQQTPVPLTDMQGWLPTARECIRALLTERLGDVEITYDVYREWSGGWRIATEVRGPVSGGMDFVLLRTPQGGLLAMPARLPERWRRAGVAASDGSRWTMDDEGRIVPVGAPSEDT
jgi:hypothetical protein